MPGPNITVEFSGDDAKFIRSLSKQIQAQDRQIAKLKEQGAEAKKTGKSMGDAFGDKALASIKMVAGAAGLGSIAGVLATINRHHQTWLANLRETATRAKAAMNDITAFAALQEGGKKAERVNLAARTAMRWGINDRGMAFNAVQALQSAPGRDFSGGLRAAEIVFAASKVGVPIEAGLELETIGANLGMGEGAALRQAYVAGQLSSRDPATLAGAAGGLSFWKSKPMGFAAGSVLAGGVGRDELATYVKAGGIALSNTSSASTWYAKHGLAQASEMDRLKALARAGIDTPEELAGIGIKEIRQAKAMSVMVQNVGTIGQTYAGIAKDAKPGLFMRQRAAIEAEIPAMKMQRENDMLKAAYLDEQAFGPYAMQAMQQEREERVRGLAFQRMGMRENAFGLDLIDEEGRSTNWDVFWASFGSADPEAFRGNPAPPGVGPMEYQIQQIEQDISEQGAPINSIAKDLKDATGQMKNAANNMEVTSYNLGEILRQRPVPRDDRATIGGEP